MGCNCTKEGIPDEEGRDVVSMSNRSASSPEHHKGDGLGMDQKSKQMKEMALENLSIEPGDSDSKGLPKHHVAKPAVPGGHGSSKYPGSPLHGAVSSPVWGPGVGDVDYLYLSRNRTQAVCSREKT